MAAKIKKGDKVVILAGKDKGKTGNVTQVFPTETKATVQGLNLVRIISLFYLGQWSMTAFEWFHLYIWQALIILDALVVWLVWLKYLPPRPRPALAAA